jgi:hypothetical protein
MSKDDKDETIYVDFMPNDFVIRISPVMDDEDTWTGELNVGYLTMDENYMSKEDYAHVDIVTNMTLSAIPLMEEDMQVRSKLYKYTMDALNSTPEEHVKAVTAEHEDDSNVIKLRFQ